MGAVYLQWGLFLEKAGREEESAAVYKKVPSNLPQFPEALFNIARLYRKLNQIDGERQAYERLRDIPEKNNSFRTSGLLQFAEIYMVKNDAERARACYQDVLQNATDDQTKKSAADRLKALQK